MSPEQERIAIQREASASQHIVAPALELARTSPTFRRAVLAIEREKRRPLRCAFCGNPTDDGHVHDFGQLPR